MGEKTNEVIIHEQAAQTTIRQHEGLSETDRLHAEIERTRLEMSRTLDEIKSQLSPTHLRERVKERMKEASIGRTKRMMRNANSQMRSTIREHPITSALLGLSAFWLLKEGFQAARGGDGEFEEYYPEREYLAETEPLEGTEPFAETSPLGGEEAFGGRVSEKKEQLKGGLESARERVAKMGEETRLRTRQYREKAREKAGRLAGRTRETAVQQKEKAQSSFNRMLQERPLVVTTAAVALGAIIASLIPESRKEHELMGEQKEKIGGRLKEKAQESFEKAKTVAKDTAEFAKKEAKERI